MSEIDGQVGVTTSLYESEWWWVSPEELYQHFKARMAAEIKRREDLDDFPLGEACDLSKEGGCDSCQ